MPKYVHFIGEKLSSVLGQLISLHIFWGEKCKNRLFWRKNDFECIFDRFEVLVVIIWSSQL